MRHRLRHWSHTVGFDDTPFPPDHRGNMLVFGAVYADARLDGVLSCRVRRDGVNATPRLAACIRQSRFYPQLHTVLLQGIEFAGFNVVDIHGLNARATVGGPYAIGCPVQAERRARSTACGANAL